ncbi:MAG: hypothetical protein ABIP94_01580 [Planctomycetota bacterium]
MQVDLRAIAEGVIKNNMGVGGIELRVRGTLAAGKATLLDTGQVLAVSGGPERSSMPWLWFDAKEFGLDMVDAVKWLGESAVPTER